MNSASTVDSSLNKVIVRPEVGCLGMVKLENRRWGFVELHLQAVTPVEFEVREEKQLMYFRLIVENGEKQELSCITTEAREVGVAETHYSNSGRIRFKFIERKKGEMYSLRVVAKVISPSSH